MPEQELNYEDAMEEGAALAMEEVQDRLDAAGLEMDEETGEIITGPAIMDPRPRGRKGRGRRKGKKRNASGRFAKPWHHKYGSFRYMDPAPRFAKARGYARRAKDPLSKMLNKVAPFAGVVGMAGVFYTEYKKRATALGVAGVGDAISQDIKNFDLKAATDRVIANAGAIAAPAVVGYIVKQIPIGPAKIRQITGNLMIGGSGGLLAKHILDPPIVGAPNSEAVFSMAQAQRTVQMNGVPTWGGM